MAIGFEQRPGTPQPESAPPGPGSLGIEERRSWATWQVLVTATATFFVGMLIGYLPKKPASDGGGGTGGTSKPFVTLPPASGSPRLGGGTATATTRAGLQPGTTVGVTTTVKPSSSPSTSAVVKTGPIVVLIPNTTGNGPDQLTEFTTGGAWSIGWAFDCVGAPGGAAPFKISVVGTSGTLPVVTLDTRQGTGVTPEISTGSHSLTVTTDPACRWAIKVTGVAG